MSFVKDEYFSDLMDLSKSDLAFFYKTVAVVEFSKSDTLNIKIFYSNTTTYGLLIGLNLVHNALLKSLAGDEFEISASTKALPATYKYFLKVSKGSVTSNDLAAYLRVSIFTFFIFVMFTYFIIYPSMECNSGFKHLQLMTGTSGFTYWFTLLTFDLIVFSISVFICVSCIVIVDLIMKTKICTFTEICKYCFFFFLQKIF